MNGLQPAPRLKTKKRFNAVAFLEVVVAFVLFGVLVVVIAGFVPISVPAFARAAETALLQNGADSCTIQRGTVTAWKGFSLHGITVVKNIDSLGVVMVRVPTVTVYGNTVKAVIEHYIGRTPAYVSLPIASEKGLPTVDLLKTYIGQALRFEALQSVTIGKSDVEVRRADSAVYVVQDLKAECRISGHDVRSLVGTISAGSLSIVGGRAARSLSAEFVCDTTALTVNECKGTVFDGKVRCAGVADLARGRLKALSLTVKNLDLGEWYRWNDTANGYLLGSADLDLLLDSSDLVLDSLRGRGNLSVRHCVLARFPFQKMLVNMFAYPHFARPRFDKLEADFTVTPGMRLTAQARAKNDTIIVSSNGWIRATGTLDQSITCEFTRVGTARLNDFMRKTLEETRNDGRLIRCRIHGNIASPKFEIESKKILEKAVQNLFNDVRFNLQQWLR